MALKVSSRCLLVAATDLAASLAARAPSLVPASSAHGRGGRSSANTTSRSRVQQARRAGYPTGRRARAASAGAFSSPVTSSHRWPDGAQHPQRERDPLWRRLGRSLDARVAAGCHAASWRGEQRGGVAIGARCRGSRRRSPDARRATRSALARTRSLRLRAELARIRCTRGSSMPPPASSLSATIA